MARLTVFDEHRGLYDMVACYKCEHHTAETCLWCEHIIEVEQKLAAYEEAEELGMTITLPFRSKGLLAVVGKDITVSGKSDSGEEIIATGKLCILECSEEEATRHDKWADEILAVGCTCPHCHEFHCHPVARCEKCGFPNEGD